MSLAWRFVECHGTQKPSLRTKRGAVVQQQLGKATKRMRSIRRNLSPCACMDYADRRRPRGDDEDGLFSTLDAGVTNALEESDRVRFRRR